MNKDIWFDLLSPIISILCGFITFYGMIAQWTKYYNKAYLIWLAGILGFISVLLFDIYLYYN